MGEMEFQRTFILNLFLLVEQLSFLPAQSRYQRKYTSNMGRYS